MWRAHVTRILPEIIRINLGQIVEKGFYLFINIFIYIFIVLILRVWGLGTVSPRIFPIILIPIGLNNK